MMKNFPDFMKNPINAVKSNNQSPIKGIEGYIFDGKDGSQMIIWQCPYGGKSDYHTHNFDEYFIVVQGWYKGDFGSEIKTIKQGEECFIPKGTPHNGEYSEGFRGIFAFSEKRAERK